MAGMYETENMVRSTGEAVAPCAGSGVIERGEELVSEASSPGCYSCYTCSVSQDDAGEDLALVTDSVMAGPCGFPCFRNQDEELSLAEGMGLSACTLPPCTFRQDEELVAAEASPVCSGSCVPSCRTGHDEDVTSAEELSLVQGSVMAGACNFPPPCKMPGGERLGQDEELSASEASPACGVTLCFPGR